MSTPTPAQRRLLQALHEGGRLEWELGSVNPILFAADGARLPLHPATYWACRNRPRWWIDEDEALTPAGRAAVEKEGAGDG